jgi:predicted DNA-binding protein (MmcQ/YjbR family)
MNPFGFDEVRVHCLAQMTAVEDFPFGPDIYVYKTLGKVFAILSVKEGLARVNLKADPTEALMLRQMFSAVTPGYHMNKRHWNTVLLDGSVPEGELKRQIEQSWALVQPKKTRKKVSAASAG